MKWKKLKVKKEYVNMWERYKSIWDSIVKAKIVWLKLRKFENEC